MWGGGALLKTHDIYMSFVCSNHAVFMLHFVMYMYAGGTAVVDAEANSVFILYLCFILLHLCCISCNLCSIVGSLRDREVACSASGRQGSNLESCVWRTVSSQSSHHPQEVLLAQFSLYVHNGGLKPDSFHFL